jgi:hypothetical protein
VIIFYFKKGEEMMTILLLAAGISVIGIIVFSVIDVFASFRTARVFAIIAAIIISIFNLIICIMSINNHDLSAIEIALVGGLIGITVGFWLKLPGGILKDK